MEYIVCKNYNKKGLNGKDFNLLKGTTCNCTNSIIYYNNEPICYTTSQHAYDYFSRNDDNKGEARFALVEQIFSRIQELVREYNEEVSKIDIEDEEEREAAIARIPNKVYLGYTQIRNTPTLASCLKDNDDIFNYNFYNAELEILNTILEIFE